MRASLATCPRRYDPHVDYQTNLSDQHCIPTITSTPHVATLHPRRLRTWLPPQGRASHARTPVIRAGSRTGRLLKTGFSSSLDTASLRASNEDALSGNAATTETPQGTPGSRRLVV
ncbi:hypothetical protein ONZ51_g3297 [Trametes cubensis]|uniref:Uncharacterized protein n=1 Tax=Trametes cubensis TaxID=1111947 RepID=A0AAD7XB92_9APHY|nr:hypothetical protein ONZ51_g3297 [Trametes cubensis]